MKRFTILLLLLLFTGMLVAEIHVQANLAVHAPGMIYKDKNNGEDISNLRSQMGISPGIVILSTTRIPKLMLGTGADWQLKRTFEEGGESVPYAFQTIFITSHYQLFSQTNKKWEAIAHLGYDTYYEREGILSDDYVVNEFVGGIYYALGAGTVFSSHLTLNLLLENHNSKINTHYLMLGKAHNGHHIDMMFTDATMQIGYRF
jgi:hypothetical protein